MSMAVASVTIRPATAADTPTLERFAAGLQEFELPLDATLMPAAEMLANGYVPAMLREMAEEQGLTLIAELAGRPVGYGHCIVKVEDDTTMRPEARQHVYVTDLFVEEASRGRGAAQALLAAMQDHAQALGIRRMRITTLASNARAARAYRRFGFRDHTLNLERTLPDGS